LGLSPASKIRRIRTAPRRLCRGEGTAHDHFSLTVRPEAAGLVGNAPPSLRSPPFALFARTGNERLGVCVFSAQHTGEERTRNPPGRNAGKGGVRRLLAASSTAYHLSPGRASTMGKDSGDFRDLGLTQKLYVYSRRKEDTKGMKNS
jgi:hypothetical protein